MIELAHIVPAHTFDGGDLDCGSGLALLIRQAMTHVPEGEFLEVRSREPSVESDLPPWCRLSGHEYIGALPAEVGKRYFVKRGVAQTEMEAISLDDDLQRAKSYEWRLRARSTGNNRTAVYCRNFTIEAGQSASFEERDQHPSAVELMLSAVAGDLAATYFAICTQRNILLDEVELTISGKLHNVLAHLGVETGDPSLASITVKCYVTASAAEQLLKDSWQECEMRAPVAATLRKVVEWNSKLVIV